MQKGMGFVVIGRNEGERLKRCLASLDADPHHVVYVDSGSTDASVEHAKEIGIDVVELDMSIPFTAARARNEGVKQLLSLTREIDYVQFIDGDCEVVSGWTSRAKEFLDAHADVAVVCGRRVEKYPDHSIYNLLCDIEWDTPIGETKACGGDAMFRVAAFEQVLGFRSDLIAGEEPELCVRLRNRGWRIWRLPGNMTLHDAAMSHFGQWWKRTVRSGYAFAQGAYLHGSLPERHWVREMRSALLWGLLMPLGIFLLGCWHGPWAFGFLLIYPLQVMRLAVLSGYADADNWWRAIFLVAGKFPEMVGGIQFFSDQYMNKQSALIEYK